MEGLLLSLTVPPVFFGLKVLVVKIALLCVFVLSANFRITHLMGAAVRTTNADCFDSRSFISSVGIAGYEFKFDVHAVYRKCSEIFGLELSRSKLL